MEEAIEVISIDPVRQVRTSKEPPYLGIKSTVRVENLAANKPGIIKNPPKDTDNVSTATQRGGDDIAAVHQGVEDTADTAFRQVEEITNQAFKDIDNLHREVFPPPLLKNELTSGVTTEGSSAINPTSRVIDVDKIGRQAEKESLRIQEEVNKRMADMEKRVDDQMKKFKK